MRVIPVYEVGIADILYIDQVPVFKSNIALILCSKICYQCRLRRCHNLQFLEVGAFMKKLNYQLQEQCSELIKLNYASYHLEKKKQQRLLRKQTVSDYIMANQDETEQITL